MRRHSGLGILAVAIVSVLTLPSFACADDIPSQLYDKTITASWTVKNVLRDDKGRVIAPTVVSKRLIYISSAGRAFMKAEFKSARRSAERKYAPGESTVGGTARDVAFEDGKLVASSAFQQGAIRIAIAFDGPYSKCTVDIRYGRDGGANIRRKSIDGVMREIVESHVSGETCSISTGNLIAE